MINSFSLEENARESKRLNALLNGGIRDQLMKYPGVKSVSVGLKISKNELIWERCFHVYVDKKLAKAQLQDQDIIPEEIEGIKTDVHQIEQIASASPVAQGGVQISNGIELQNAATGRFMATFGTLGAIGKDKSRSCNVVGLTNWHVLYIGHRRVPVLRGTRIFQPNAETSLNSFGDNVPDPHTKDNDVGKVIDGVYNATVDCAVFEVNRSCSNCCGVEYHNIIAGLETISPLGFNGITGTATAHAGDTVFFVGAVSSASKGFVVSEGAALTSSYLKVMICDERIVPQTPLPGPDDLHTIILTGQLKIRTDGLHPRNANIQANGVSYSRFVEHGDSGSLLVNVENKAVGLIFGTDGLDHLPQNPPANPPGVPPLPPGSPEITLYGYANHYSNVIAALQNIGIQFEINYSQAPAGGSRGEALHRSAAEPDSEALLIWKKRVESHPKSRAISDAITRYRDEVMQLINHCRPVTVKWHRNKGPAFAAAVAGNVREGKFEYPNIVNGVTAVQLLSRMREILMEVGSVGLRADIIKYGDEILTMIDGRTSFDDLLQAFQPDYTDYNTSVKKH
jgi:hypothetical protein